MGFYGIAWDHQFLPRIDPRINADTVCKPMAKAIAF